MQNMKSISPLGAMHPRTAIGIGVSVLIHALILFLAMAHPSPRPRDAGPVAAARMPLTVRLILRQPAPEAPCTPGPLSASGSRC